jgi:hypothetical protein
MSAGNVCFELHRIFKASTLLSLGMIRQGPIFKAPTLLSLGMIRQGPIFKTFLRQGIPVVLFLIH